MATSDDLHRLRGRLDALEDLISQAPASTDVTDLHEAHASLAVGRLVAEWVERDRVDADGSLGIVTALLQAGGRTIAASYPGWNRGWSEWRRVLPSRQAADALTAVDAAIEAASTSWAPPVVDAVVRPLTSDMPPPLPHGARMSPQALASLPDWSLVDASIGEDGYWRSAATNRVVFGQ